MVAHFSLFSHLFTEVIMGKSDFILSIKIPLKIFRALKFENIGNKKFYFIFHKKQSVLS